MNELIYNYWAFVMMDNTIHVHRYSDPNDLIKVLGNKKVKAVTNKFPAINMNAANEYARGIFVSDINSLSGVK